MLTKTANDYNSPIKIVDAVVEVNAERKKAMATKIIKAMGGDVKGKSIALLGLAFKPNTDDMRDAPALDIIPALQEAGATIRAFDPEAMHEASNMMTDIVFCDGAYHAVENADAMVILTEWDQFRALDLDRVKSLLKGDVVVDLRNVYDPADMKRRGFSYDSVGRPQA